ncbi:MAG: glycosyltransferase [Deltaproteobacteria bacterium]|nr:glycosyltransferase [Deltaproteobacteria bacterium]
MSLLLSVIIPTRNRAQRIGDLLDSLAVQNPVPFRWEVLVIDNGSTDQTSQIVHQKMSELPIKIRYIHEPRLGLHHGRHRGANEAEGSFVGYLDDDMVLAPTWIQGVDMVASDKAVAVVGRILPKWEAKPPEWLLKMASNGVFGYLGLLDLGGEKKPIDPMLVFGGNCFLPKKIVFSLGGFHPDGVPTEHLRWRGDGETALMSRFKKAGYRAYYDPCATAYHIIPASRLTIEYICNRAYNQGISRSFSDIRHNGGLMLQPSPETTENLYKQFTRVCLKVQQKSFMEMLGAFWRRIASTLCWFSRDAKISRQVRTAYLDGYEFHRNEVRNDPELLSYVLKKNYLECDQ